MKKEKKLLKRFSDWLNEKDRQNWEIERYVEDLVNQLNNKNLIKERLITIGLGTFAVIIVLGFIILVNFYLHNR